MQPFRVHLGLVAPLWRRDIDTDQIIPKQFLKSIERKGFGRHLFHDWRTNPDGTERHDFVLNDPRYAGASILVTGDNFGCGSSREHAAWALEDFGFRAVIAPSFADIFRNNAITNGIVPVTVSTAVAEGIASRAASAAGYRLAIDLEARRIRDAQGTEVEFEIDDGARDRLLQGLDDIGVILQYEQAIAQYERRR